MGETSCVPTADGMALMELSMPAMGQEPPNEFNSI